MHIRAPHILFLLLRGWRIRRFWKWFEKNRGMLETFVSDPVLYPYELLNALRKINRNLHQDSCERPDGIRELIVTANNNPRLFRLVDAIIARAPRIKGWQFIAPSPSDGIRFIVRTRDAGGWRGYPDERYILYRRSKAGKVGDNYFSCAPAGTDAPYRGGCAACGDKINGRTRIS